MATAQKRQHLYIDRQHPPESATEAPPEEPKDAEHVPLTPVMFARQRPSAEDEFFFEQSERSKEPASAAKGATFRAPGEKPASATEPTASLLERLLNALNRRMNTNWRP
ncbi:hypothetical protein WDW86_19200 [Bdellovibrionota bacterium FG-2]